MSYRDPTCRIATPGHICTRRDGHLLTGSNGDCFAQAAAETHLPAPTVCKRDGCIRFTRNPDGYCSHTCRVIAGAEHIDYDYERHGFGAVA